MNSTPVKKEAAVQTIHAPTILVTGATGTIGSALIQELAERNVPFRVLVRSSSRAQSLPRLPRMEVVIGDFDDAESIRRALEGMERAFLVTNSTERAETQQRSFVDAAQRAGVRHIVKLSQWAADPHSPVRFLRYHAAVEQHIRESGIAYTFLRPNLFMQGFLSFRDTIATQGRFFAPIGNARVSAVDIRDIAMVAATALVDNGHQGKIYGLTGPEALTHQDMADKLADAAHRPVEFVDIPPQAMRETLLAIGFPEWQADGVVEDYAHYGRGEAAGVTTGVYDATGKQPRSFDIFAHDYALAFS